MSILDKKEELQEINDYLKDLKENFDISDHLSERELDDRTIETLNECFGSINIAGREYDAGDILKELNPMMFDQAYGEEIYHENSNCIFEMENDDYDRIIDIVEGLEDKIDRKEELEEEIEELESKREVKKKKKLKP